MPTTVAHSRSTQTHGCVHTVHIVYTGMYTNTQACAPHAHSATHTQTHTHTHEEEEEEEEKEEEEEEKA